MMPEKRGDAMRERGGDAMRTIARINGEGCPFLLCFVRQYVSLVCHLQSHAHDDRTTTHLPKISQSQQQAGSQAGSRLPVDYLEPTPRPWICIVRVGVHPSSACMHACIIAWKAGNKFKTDVKPILALIADILVLLIVDYSTIITGWIPSSLVASSVSFFQ
jgi:hypothetical protein